jgi:hypothetical protein
MSDVLFRFLRMARERDLGRVGRLFMTDERLLAAGLVREVETAAVRIQVCAQYEQVTFEEMRTPASEQHRITFYNVPEPHRPAPGTLAERVERFPIRSSLRTAKCPGCEGSGRRVCPSCSGHRQIVCESCRGFGGVSCRECFGHPLMSCKRCDPDGKIRHGACGGEGEMATWKEAIYRYHVTTTSETIFPEDASPAVRKSAETWTELHGIKPVDHSRPAIVAQLGYSTPELSEVVATAAGRAARWRSAIEQEESPQARPDRSGPCLHTVTSARVTPMAACRTRLPLSGRTVDFWLIGRGDAAVESPPPPTWDPIKVFSLPALLLVALVARRLATHQSLSRLTHEFPHAMALTTAILGLGALAGALLLGAAARRIVLAGRGGVRVIAVVPCAGAPTTFLTCLAAVGSLIRKIEVCDHTYRSDVRLLMGDSGAAQTSRTVALRTRSGEIVRLVEVQPGTMSRAEWARVAATADGILYLEDPEHRAAQAQGALRDAAEAVPPEAFVQLASARQPAAGGLDLEAIRRAFVRETNTPVEWPAIFQRLWAPIAAVSAQPPDEARRLTGGGLLVRSSAP